MIFVSGASLKFKEQKIFDDISLSLNSNQHVGLVGRNGSGKTTFLKVIAGITKLDEGEIAIEKNKKLAYMPQEMVLTSDKTIFDEAFFVFAEFIALENKKIELELLFEQGKQVESEIDNYLKIIEKLEHFDKAKSLAKTKEILLGLGFKEERFNEPVTNLSVGWKMRLVLVKLLLQEADFYLFDEPTNHLDIVAKEWFYRFLKDSNFGYLLVSHDRFFLDNVCDYIYELERGNGKLYKGNFSEYLIQKEHQKALQAAAYATQQKEIAQKQETIERFRYKASKAKMAQSMIKKLDQIELLEAPEPELPKVHFTFPESQRSGRIVLEFENLHKRFGNKQIFDNISGKIERGEKVSLVAPNGAGKTTLFNLIVGKYKEDNPRVFFGNNVNYAIFEQDQLASLDPKKTILEQLFHDCASISEQTIRNFLGSFLFSGDEVEKKISVLSGGERNRVGMVKILLQKANLLILDEPTNHLDLYSKEVLLQALLDFNGTIFFVSHDYDFINRLSTRILELTPHKLNSYPGNYDSYLMQKKHAENVTQAKTKIVKEDNTKINNDKPVDKKLKAQLYETESKITKLEKQIEKMHQDFAKIDYGSSDYENLAKKFKLAQAELEDLTNFWEKLQKQQI